jgi:hypothetical protein
LPSGVVATEDADLPVVTVVQLEDESVETEWNENPAWTANDEPAAAE